MTIWYRGINRNFIMLNYDFDGDVLVAELFDDGGWYTAAVSVD